MPGAVDPWDAVRRRVAQQAHYLRNPLDPFSLPAPPDDFPGARVLLFDDTWTTGARVQSASYAMKRAGAERVAAIVLGRHANPEFVPWEPILRTIKDRPCRQETCAVHVD